MKKKNKNKKKNSKIFILYFALVIVILIIVLFFLSNKKIIPSASDWPTANQNLSNTRSAVNSKINLSNISQLGLAWTFPIKGVGEWGAAATNPLIIGNKVYFQDLKSNIYSLNFKTGKQIWTKKYDTDVIGPTGVAVGYNKIFAIKGHYNVVALDASGKELWSTNLSQNQNIGVDIQPVVYNNMVFVSTVPGVSNENFYTGGSVGTIYTLNAQTGKIIWSFDTVDSKDIWGNAKINSGGGAWYPPAIDTVNNVSYWGIGNPAPWPGTKEFPNGSSRPGDNLYTSSIVALNQTNGKLLWYNQVAPHDLFDYDFQVSPILTTITVKGIKKDIVIGAGKMGKVLAFDRKNGEIIWQTPVGDHINDVLKVLPNGTTQVTPSPLGGVETCLAYSDGIVYVPVVNMTVEYTPTELIKSSFDLSVGKGELVAINATTGEILWDKRFDSVNVGAATVVNDLVFTSTYNGKIYAFNKKTGDQVWQYQVPGGINGWPAVKGDTIIFPVGLGKNPSLFAFKIGSKLQIPVSTPIPAAPGKEFKQ